MECDEKFFSETEGIRGETLREVDRTDGNGCNVNS